MPALFCSFWNIPLLILLSIDAYESVNFQAAGLSTSKSYFSHSAAKCAIKATDEGIDISQSLLRQGYIEEKELSRFPDVPGKRIKGLHPVIKCTQNIPCNPCQDACKFGCIKVGDKITRLPEVDMEATCAGCGKCVVSCSGQAIFLIDEDYEEAYGTVTMAYEFLPYPVQGRNRSELPGAGRYARDNSAGGSCEI